MNSADLEIAARRHVDEARAPFFTDFGDGFRLRRSRLNLEAEALAQLTALESTSEYDAYEEGTATLQSRLGYVKERLRLLYVGITRAKKDLIVTWNSGRQGDATPSLALSELMGWWEGQG